MKGLKENIKKILVEGLLENKLPKLEKHIIEHIESKNTDELSNSDIEEKIYQRFLEKKKYFEEMDLKLKTPENFNYLGEYIDLLISRYEIDSTELLNEVKIDRDTFKKILKNAMDLTVIDINKLVKLCIYFKINLTVTLELLSKSLKLFKINPTPAYAMARYSYRDGKEERSISMRKGLNELIIKASEQVPFKSEERVSTNIDVTQFLLKFEEEYKNVSSLR